MCPPGLRLASSQSAGFQRTGVVETLLASTDFELVERGTVDVVNEWPDVPTAVRALAVAGPSVPAIEAVGYERFCEELSQVVAPLFVATVGVTIVSEFGWVTAVAR